MAKRPRSQNGPPALSSDSQDGTASNNHQQIPSSPHVPTYLPTKSTAATKPPRQGYILRLKMNKTAAKLPTPPAETSIPPIPHAPSVPEPPPRHGTLISLSDQPVKSVPQYLPAPHPILPSQSSAFKNVNRKPQSAPPTAVFPPEVGSFTPINGNGIIYLPSNHEQQDAVGPAAGNPRPRHVSQPPTLPKNGKYGTVMKFDEDPAKSAQPPSLVHPKDSMFLKSTGPAPVTERALHEKPPKNGTIIDFQQPYKRGNRKKKT